MLPHLGSRTPGASRGPPWARNGLMSTLLGFARVLLHLFSQTQRSHIGPHFFDVCQAFRFQSTLANVLPTERILSVRRPDGVLLFVIHHHFIDGGVLLLVSVHEVFLHCQQVKCQPWPSTAKAAA